MNKVLAGIGICISAGYSIAMLLFLDARMNQLNTMPLNEVGDFLAGIFGPIAIFWLVLGFFQQGIEIRLNTKALELQAEELKNSVEQQRDLVEVTKKQLDADIEALRYERQKEINAAKPKFIFSGSGGIHRGNGQSTYSCSIINIGNQATEVRLSPSLQLRKFTLTKLQMWQRDQTNKLEWEYQNWVPEPGLTVTISYLDALGMDGDQSFEFIPNMEGEHPSVVIRRIEEMTRSDS